jgi:hypothetical protein
MSKYHSFRNILIITILSSLIHHGCISGDDCTTTATFPVLTGDYFGQAPPGKDPELFAPGLISTELFTRDIAMTPEGDEIFFTSVVGRYNITQILHTRRIDGVWTSPEVALFSGNIDYMDAEPFITPDGKRLLFLSNRPDTVNGKPANQDIWAADRTEDGWSDAYNIGGPINTEAPEFFPSVTRDGTFYFTRNVGRNSFIFRSRLIDGKYEEPEKLPEQVNSLNQQYNAFIAPDESYIIVPSGGREDCLGGDDYYIFFRNSDDTWSEPINMGTQVNSKYGSEHSAYLSPDGRYFFFMSGRISDDIVFPNNRITRDIMLRMHNGPGEILSSIYWMDASFIKDLKP